MKELGLHRKSKSYYFLVLLQLITQNKTDSAWKIVTIIGVLSVALFGILVEIRAPWWTKCQSFSFSWTWKRHSIQQPWACYNPLANYKVLANGSTRHWPTDRGSWPIGWPIWPMGVTWWIGQPTDQWVDLFGNRLNFKTHLSKPKNADPPTKYLAPTPILIENLQYYLCYKSCMSPPLLYPNNHQIN